MSSFSNINNNNNNNTFESNNLFGLPGGGDFGFNNIFDSSQGIGSQEQRDNRPATKDSWAAFLEQGDLHNAPVQPQAGADANIQFDGFNNFAQLDGANVSYLTSQDTTMQSQSYDPSLMQQFNQEQPKYRTDSGSEVVTIRGQNGEWLHPRNGRVLDERELRWDGPVPFTSAPSNYSIPQIPFDPMLAAMPMSIDMGTSFSYPDPLTYAPIDNMFTTEQTVHTNDIPSVLPTIQEDTDEIQMMITQRRKSSGSTQGARINRRQPLYNVQTPKADQERPWVRVNSATKGNTRTGKTNTYGDGPYISTLHPFGVSKPRWTASNGTTFRYNQWGELNSVAFEAEDIERFICEHPFHNEATRATLPQEQQEAILKSQAKLIIWIQKMPGDSAKRVNTQHGLKCRVHECPAGIYKARTINTGHYRVALDEQWATYGDTRNPMHVAGYAHLYCMERFFDFAALCRQFDVRADDRQMPGEPTGEWVAGLGQGTEEFKMARDFITAAKTGKGAERWTTYPSHDPRRPGARKQHDRTLVHKLVDRKAAATGHSKMRMMQARGRTATQFFVNMGDLQLQIDTQQERNAKRAQSTKGRPTLKRKMVDEEEEEEAQESGNESDGAEDGDPDADYAPRSRKRSKRTSTNPRRGSYQAAGAGRRRNSSGGTEEGLSRLRKAT